MSPLMPARFSVSLLVLSLVALLSASGIEFYDHGNPSDLEQLLLERINGTRANPAPIGARLGVPIRDPSPRQPLVFHPKLLQAAVAHSEYLIAKGTFSHQGAGNTNAQQRMAAAGYPFGGGYEGWAENLGLYELLGVTELDALHRTQDLLFKSAEHRRWILEPGFREAGLGISTGRSPVQGATRDVIVVTEKFAVSGASPSTEKDGSFLQGVVYNDVNENGRYDLGEGAPGVNVTPNRGGYYTVTSASGGYAVPMANHSGPVDVKFTCPGVDHTLSLTMTPNLNAKLDLRLQDHPQPEIEPASGEALEDDETAPDLDAVPLLRIVGVDGNQLTFEIGEDASEDELTLQYSADLLTWESIPADLEDTFRASKIGRHGFFRIVPQP